MWNHNQLLSLCKHLTRTMTDTSIPSWLMKIFSCDVFEPVNLFQVVLLIAETSIVFELQLLSKNL